MAITSMTMVVSSIVSNDDFTIFAFVGGTAVGSVGQLTYGEGFEDYVWVQNEKLTTEGIAVHPYGALIVPSAKLATVGVKELELVSDGVSGKPDSESETMLSGLEIGSSVAFTFGSDSGDSDSGESDSGDSDSGESDSGSDGE